MNQPKDTLAADREKLLATLKAQLPRLHELYATVQDRDGYEDPVYRFYHQSFKVYDLQNMTEEIVAALSALRPDPDRPLNEWFMTIIGEGTGKIFEPTHNQRWLTETRPIVEAFFHARFFLEMAVKYGRGFEGSWGLPSGWAALLYLYDLR